MYAPKLFWTSKNCRPNYLFQNCCISSQYLSPESRYLVKKSTAILFGSKTKAALYFFYLIFIATIAITINIIVIKNLYINSLFLFFIFMHLFSQIFFLNINNPDNCLKIFKSNNSLGIIIFMLLLSNYF